jgi:diaminopimelate epimerase
MPDGFVKGHALGNDYVVVDPGALTFRLDADAVVRLCDRHRGIGSDGILALAGSTSADAGLRIWNPDGSQAEKSGNGVRIFARWLADEGRVPGDAFTIETPGGIVACRLHRRDGRIEDITIDMGAATFRSQDIPCAGPPRDVVAEDVDVGGRLIRITALSVGNPHCVVLTEEDPAGMDLGRLGPALERHPLFPHRTNVQLARVEGHDRVRVRVWERGAGETMASGSSACAVAAACVRLGRTGRAVTVVMDGGALAIEVGERWDLRMTGPAVLVYRGVLASSFVATLGR